MLSLAGIVLMTAEAGTAATGSESADASPAAAERETDRFTMTMVGGLDLAHSLAVGEPGEATSFGLRFDSDARWRLGLLSVRTRFDLAVGGGSRLTGDLGAGALIGVAPALSTTAYGFLRGGVDGFYRQRPRGYMGVLEVPKVELGLGMQPLSPASRALRFLAMETSMSAALVAGGWAGDDDDASLDRWRRSLVPAVGLGTAWTSIALSLRMELVRVATPEGATMFRARPCFAALYIALCIDTEVQEARYRAVDGAVVDRAIVTAGALVGVGLAGFGEAKH